MKETTRKSFPIYRSWGKNVDKLSTEEKALLLDKLFDFYYGDDTIEIPDNMIRLDMFWDSINHFIIENEEKYQATSTKRSNNMSKARQSNPKLQSSKNDDTHPVGINTPTKLVSNVNVNDNVNENENVDGNGDDKVNGNGSWEMIQMMKLEEMANGVNHSEDIELVEYEAKMGVI